ncbi:MAG: hypothetical protein KBD01_08360 [Acidobacteria bacterium]|nr:hypothetical protein [Acidobacteriota bacterium]
MDSPETTRAEPPRAAAPPFTWHGTGRALLEAQLDAIARARGSVRLEVFTFSDSAVGRRFGEALTAAAERGARVRVLADAIGSLGLRRDYFAGLVRAGGEVRRFNEPRPATFTFRDHRKLLVVDEHVAFVGGCNIAEEYYGDGITVGWRDGGVEVRGPVAAVLAAEFDRQWERASGENWRFLPGGTAARVTAGPAGEIEALFIKPGLGRNPLRDALRRDIAGAKEIAITSAYFLPSKTLRRELAAAVARGARVRLLLAGRSDVRLMQLASRSLYRRLVERGIEIHEYQPQILHAKSIVIDEIVFAGSSNLDPRSLRINFEIMLRIRDAGLAQTALRQFEDDLARRATRITREFLQNERPWFERFKQRLALWLLARLDPEFARLKLRRWHLAQRRGRRRAL